VPLHSVLIAGKTPQNLALSVSMYVCNVCMYVCIVCMYGHVMHTYIIYIYTSSERHTHICILCVYASCVSIHTYIHCIHTYLHSAPNFENIQRWETRISNIFLLTALAAPLSPEPTTPNLNPKYVFHTRRREFKTISCPAITSPLNPEPYTLHPES